MRVVMIGTGYVGLVTGACFAEFGSTVTCVDQNAAKIAALNLLEMPIYEPGLRDLIDRNVNGGRLSFTTDLAEPVRNADIVFIAVGTPTREEDGGADLSYVFAAARQVAAHLQGYTVIVTKSTVTVGATRQVAEHIRAANPSADFDVVSNPEFLREGSAINDFMRPDRVVIGVESERAQEIMRTLYRPLNLIETPLLFTTIETSELIKYAANGFLATKIAFINEISNVCDQVGANVQDVAKGIGLDGRIGRKFLHVGPGYGGSCFPKDTRALAQIAHDHKTPLRIVDAVIAANEHQKLLMVEKIKAACGGCLQNKIIAVLGLTFKPNTDDMREAPSLTIIPGLQKAGARVRAFDPIGMREARGLLSHVEWGKDAYEILENADAVVILTEWNEFRGLDLKRVKNLLKAPLMIDLRNIYKPEELQDADLTYISIGRQPVRGNSTESLPLKPMRASCA